MILVFLLASLMTMGLPQVVRIHLQTGQAFLLALDDCQDMRGLTTGYDPPLAGALVVGRSHIAATRVF